MRSSMLLFLREMLRMVKRWAGLFATVSLIMVFVQTVVVYLYAPMLSRVPTFIDVLLTFIAASAFFMTVWSLALLATRHPGVTPSCLAEERMEEFMRGVLADVVQRGDADETHEEGVNGEKGTVSHDIAAAEAKDWLAEGHSVNRAVAAVQEPHLRSANAHQNSTDIAVDVMNAAEDLQVQQKQQHEGQQKQQQQQQRITDGSYKRCRRRHNFGGADGKDLEGSSGKLWLPHRNIFLVASDALAALDRSTESCEQEMSFLLGGARRCRFCRIYKISETHHCSKCRICVYEMDHHCPWIGQCIGHDNHKHLLLFMIYLIVFLGTSLLHILVFKDKGRTSILLEDTSSILLFVVILSGTFIIILLVFFAQDLFLLGKGDSTLRLLRREERRDYESRRRGAYAFLIDDNSDSGDGVAARRFNFKNLRRVFGTGSVWPWWFLPLRPQRPSPVEQEAELWAAHRAIALRQLRAIADADDTSGGSSDEEMKEE
ncbi:putative palmitoyl acyltransferase 6 [Trypanosoma cruzi]|nr:putative palmitoyl acyltransferase 6 [Trypanosoma cruzi]